MTSDLMEYRKYFPVTERYAYLNHAAIAPYSTRVQDAIHALVEARVQCDELLEECAAVTARLREMCAQLAGGTPDEITLTRNTSHGLNIVANGITWHPGDNIVTANTEFIANVYPWTNLRRRGVEVRFAPTRENRILVEDLAQQVDGRTRLIALSYVEFFTGFRNDLAAIGQLCDDRGLFFCIDAIQGLGALSFDAREVNADFVATGGPKWLMGPVGTGFLWCRDRYVEELQAVMAGWCGVVDNEDYFRYDSCLRSDASRFEEGSLYILGMFGLEASLEMLLDIGIPRIEERILSLTGRLIEGLQERGYQIVSPIRSRRERSGIVTFLPKDGAVDELYQRLTQADIVVSKRGPGIRVSPHFYNTEEEIDRLLETI